MRYRKGGNVKRVIKRTAAVVLAITVLCGTVAGSYQNVQAGDFSAGALQYASDFSFLEALFNASGLSLGLDMLLKTQKDIDKFKEENWDFGDLLDQPLTQKQIDEAQEKIENYTMVQQKHIRKHMVVAQSRLRLL